MNILTLSIPEFHDIPSRLRFARRVACVVSDKDITHTELARGVGVSKQRYGQWERGVGGPPTDKIGMVADLLGVNAEWLAWGRGPMLSTPSSTDAARTIAQVRAAKAAEPSTGSGPPQRRQKGG